MELHCIHKLSWCIAVSFTEKKESHSVIRKKLHHTYQEISYIKYEVDFLPIFYVENIKISVYGKVYILSTFSPKSVPSIPTIAGMSLNMFSL